MPFFQLNKNISLRRIVLLFAVCSVSLLITYFVSTEKITNDNFLMVPLTVFPVLFGFCLTVITVNGSLDAAMSVLGWKELALYQTTFKNKLIRLIILAIVYGIIISIALILRLEVCGCDSAAQKFLAKAMVWLSLISLFYSFLMPYWLYISYCERYEILSRSKGAPEV